jgi:hypothetical protein
MSAIRVSSAARAPRADHQAATAQPREKLLEIGQRNFLPLSNFVQRHRLPVSEPRQIDHCHNRITALGAQIHDPKLLFLKGIQAGPRRCGIFLLFCLVPVLESAPYRFPSRDIESPSAVVKYSAVGFPDLRLIH